MEQPLGPVRCGPLELSVRTTEGEVTLSVHCARCDATQESTWAPWDRRPRFEGSFGENDEDGYEGLRVPMFEPLQSCSEWYRPPRGALAWLDEVDRELDAITASARAGCDALARDACVRFHDSVRASIYWAVRLDGTDRVLQLTRSHPGLVLMIAHAAALARVPASTSPGAAHLLWRAVHEGMRLRDLAALLARELYLDAAEGQRLRWLTNRLSGHAAPEAVLVAARAIGVPHSDLPAEAAARLDWLHALWLTSEAIPCAQRDADWAVATMRWASACFRELSVLEPFRHSRLMRWIVLTAQAPARGHSLANLLREQEAFWDDWVEVLDDWGCFDSAETLAGNALATPPFPAHLDGDFAITPLITAAELLQESRTMRHCIFSYLPELQEGDGSAYHMQLGALSSTVLLDRVGDQYRIAEHSGEQNREVTHAEAKRVREWLVSMRVADRGDE